MFKIMKQTVAGIALLAMTSLSQAESEVSYSANLGFMSDYMYK